MDWDAFRLWAKDTLERFGNTFWQCLAGVVYVMYQSARQASPDEMIGLSDIDWLAALDAAGMAAFLAIGKGAIATMFNNPSSASLADLTPKELREITNPKIPPVIPTPDSP